MKKPIPISKIIALATLVAGAIHGWEAFEHRTMLPHLILFVFGGGAQLWLGWKWWHGEKNIIPLAAVNGGFALLWLTTRFFLPPFLTSPESFSMIGWTLFVLEFGTLILVPKLNRCLLTAVITMFAVYGAGVLGQQIMPDLIANHAYGGYPH